MVSMTPVGPLLPIWASCRGSERESLAGRPMGQPGRWYWGVLVSPVPRLVGRTSGRTVELTGHTIVDRSRSPLDPS